MNNAEITDIVGSMYEAAFDDTKWLGLAEQVANAFGSPEAGLLWRTIEGHGKMLDLTPSLAASPVRRGASLGQAERDALWVGLASEEGPGKVAMIDTLLSHTEFTDLIRPTAWQSCPLIIPAVSGRLVMSGRQVAILGINCKECKSFHEEQQRMAKTLLSHCVKVLGIRRKTLFETMEAEVSLQCMRRSGTAAMIVAHDRRVIHSNQAALKLLQSDGTFLIASGRLSVKNRADDGTLSRAIMEATLCAGANASSAKPVNGFTGTNSLTLQRQGQGRMPLTVMVSPMKPENPHIDEPCALIHIRDPEGMEPRHTALRQLFGFTPTEAAVAYDLAHGATAAMLAKHHKISLGTVRTHLKAVLSKTGTCRQAEAVTLILQSVATLSD